MKRRHARTETGYTLIELIISLTLLSTITAALVMAFITTNNANANVSERIHESNDAQIVSAFWTADAEAAGGVDPALGATDTNLGVSKTNDGGCGLGGGALVTRFKWNEWVSRDTTTTADTYVTRVANYVYRSSTAELERRTCVNGASTGVVPLASRVASAPSVTCDGSATCTALPATVSITVTETNVPATAPTAYTFTLTASVRSQGQTAPDPSSAQGSPLLVVGGSCSAGYGFHFGGSSDIVVNGDVVVNATDGPGCHAMDVNGSGHTYDAGSTTFGPGGSCSGACPPSGAGTAIGNPFASLPAPSTSGCGAGTNPAAVAGHWPPGTYPQTLTLAANQVLDPGTFVLCNGLAGGSSVRSTGVFVYVAGGAITADTVTLGAASTGTYAHIAMWNATTIDWNVHQDTVNIQGAYYSPRAGLINGNGNSSVTIGVIVVKYLDFSGSSDVTVTGTGAPGSPTLTATTSPTVLQEVNLTWTTTGFYQGISPITRYEVRVNTGTGWSAWTNVGTAQPYRSTCGTSPSVATTCDYQIHAVNAQGAGSPSNIAAAQSFFDAAAPAPTVTVPAANGTVGRTATISGTAGNAAGDGTPITVTVYSSADCTSGALATRTPNRTGATWTTSFTGLTDGARSVCASQSDWGGNTGRSAPVVFTVAPVVGLTATNANNRLAANDTFTVTFGQAMNPASICTGWNGTTTRTTLTVTVTNNDPTAGNNDSLTVTDSGCPFNFGKMNLGSQGWVTATTSFLGTGGNASTAVMNAGLTTLTIKIGAGTQGPNNVPVSTWTYTPSITMTDSLGVAMAGNFGFPSLRF